MSVNVLQKRLSFQTFLVCQVQLPGIKSSHRQPLRDLDHRVVVAGLAHPPLRLLEPRHKYSSRSLEGDMEDKEVAERDHLPEHLIVWLQLLHEMREVRQTLRVTLRNSIMRFNPQTHQTQTPLEQERRALWQRTFLRILQGCFYPRQYAFHLGTSSHLLCFYC